MEESSIVELPTSAQSVAPSAKFTNSNTLRQDMDTEYSVVEEGTEMSDSSTMYDRNLLSNPSKNYRKKDLYERWINVKEVIVDLRMVNKGLVRGLKPK